jgi:hypothetical protein
MGGTRRDVLEMYRALRPRDVTPGMVEAATARRLAGDVAGACAAARVDLDIDTDRITRVCGRETADLIVDDLYHIAPDLLRWNIPRALDGPGAPIGHGLLRRYEAGRAANLMVDRVRRQPDRLRLWVQTGARCLAGAPAGPPRTPPPRASTGYGRPPRATTTVRWPSWRGRCT